MIDFSAVLTDLDGNPMKDGENDATLGRIATNALLLPYQDEQNLSGEDKLKRFMLAGKARGPAVELTVEEIALAKRLIGKAYGPLVVGRAWALLDPASVSA